MTTSFSVSDFADMAEQSQAFFSPAVPTQAFAKVGIIGGQGDGKTHTAVEMAMGLHAKCKALGLPEGGNPIAFLESSEFGLDFHINRISTITGFQPVTRKAGSFAAFVEAMHVAADKRLILIVDSVSHYWAELLDSARHVLGRAALTVEDMQGVKQQWKQAMEFFKSGEFHAILSGRLGWEWGHFENEATGRRELERTNVRMQAEGDTGYECSLLVYMKKQTDASDAAHPRIYRVATVLKDKSGQIDGMSFENPTYAEFAPHFDALAIGGVHRGVDASDSRHLITDPRGGMRNYREKEILLDEVDSLLAFNLPGQDGESKRARADALKRNFGTLSRERLKSLNLDFLNRGYRLLHIQLTGMPPTVPENVAAASLPNDPGSVAMRQTPDGRMVTAEQFAVEQAGYVGDLKPEHGGPAKDATAPAEAPAADAPPPPAVKRTRKSRAKGKTAEVDALAAAPAPAAVAMPPRDAYNPARPPRPAAAEAPAPAGTPAPEPDNSKEPAPAPGSTNPAAVLAEVMAPAAAEAPAAAPRKRGRPKGSKNKGAAPETAPDAPADAVAAPAAPAPDPAADAPAAPAPRKRGRPKGSKNKATAPATPADAVEAPATPAAAIPAAAATPPAGIPVEAPAAPAAPSGASGKWAEFMPMAREAATLHGITAPQFARGLTATLGKANLLATPKEKLPPEFLSDFLDGIKSGLWNVESGEFTAPRAAAV